MRSLQSGGKPHTWTTRANPFAGVWDEVCELLDGNAGLQAKTIFAELQRRYPGRFADSQLRTLQRHIKTLACHERAAEGSVLRAGA